MTEKKIIINSSDFLRWHSIFDLLSMDAIDLEIVKTMGLEINDLELNEIRKVARIFFEYYWSERSQGNLTNEEYEEKIENFMQDIFSQISENLGLEKAISINKWGIDYFPWDGPEGAVEFRWDLFLARYAKFGAEDAIPPPKNIPKEKVKVILRIVNENTNIKGQTSDVLDALKKKARTEWDQRVYQSYEPEHSPITGLEHQIRFHNFQLMWKQIEEILTNEELESLNQWATEVDDWPWPEEFKKLPTIRIINF